MAFGEGTSLLGLSEHNTPDRAAQRAELHFLTVLEARRHPRRRCPLAAFRRELSLANSRLLLCTHTEGQSSGASAPSYRGTRPTGSGPTP